MQNLSLTFSQDFNSIKGQESPCLTCTSQESAFPYLNKELGTSTQNSWQLTSSKFLDYEVIQQDIMNWFRSKQIHSGNPQEIVSKHKDRQRKQTDSKIGKQFTLKAESASSLTRRRLARSMTINM